MQNNTYLDANESLGVRLWNVGGGAYADRVRIAYDVAGDFPASLILPRRSHERRSGHAAATRGMTLIELLVAMTLLGVVSSLVVVGVRNAVRTLTHTDDENRGLQDAKVILDRLSRDIRQARGVVCDDPAATDARYWSVRSRRQSATPTSWCTQVPGLRPAVDRRRLGLPRRSRGGRHLAVGANPDGEHFDVWRCQGALARVTPATAQRPVSSASVRPRP